MYSSSRKSRSSTRSRIIRRLAIKKDNPANDMFVKADSQNSLSNLISSKPNGIQRKIEGGKTSNINSKIGFKEPGNNGSKLPGDTRSFMESNFGSSFNDVKIFTGSSSIAMNKKLGSDAFTHGNNIYFNKGKFNPGSVSGKKLIAHELTHVVQQTGRNTKASHTIGNSPKGSAQRGLFGWIKKGLTYDWNVFKSGIAWIWNMITESPVRVWRIIAHFGSGIWDTIKWIWDGLVGGLSHVWDAFVGTFHWAKDGFFGLFSWIWRGFQSSAGWAKQLLSGNFSGFWTGIANYYKWLGDGAVGLIKWGWDGLKGAVLWAYAGNIGISKWVWRGFKEKIAWIGRLVTKLLDLVGFGEIMDLIWQIIKFNTRTLTSTEKTEAQLVFRSSIKYWQVRIDEFSFIAWIATLWNKQPTGVTTFHSINFPGKINTSPGNRDMAWLVHELTHVSQMENVGMQYMGEAIHAQFTGGYNYTLGLPHLSDYNREQQGDIARDYYYALSRGGNTSAYSKYISEMKQGKL